MALPTAWSDWRRQGARTAGVALAAVAALTPTVAGASGEGTLRTLAQMSLEQLLSVEVTSRGKYAESWLRTPAALHVLTGEEIRRAGVTSVPDALRLVPGVQVEQINASQWSVGIRGFGNRLSRAMLVLVDGRSVYNPLFAGVYWEHVGVPLDSIERIEVIRGPGGTVWGANAVNGIINIITRPAADTVGQHLSAGAGTHTRGAGHYRHGARLGPHGHVRAYARYADHGALDNDAGPDYDDWRFGQAGFRSDFALPGARALTVQGDAYHGRFGTQTDPAANPPPFAFGVDEFNEAEAGGGNLLARLERERADGAAWRAQASYSRAVRIEELLRFSADTFDLDYSRRLAARGRHNWTLGAGYRFAWQDFSGEPGQRFLPAQRNDALWSAHAQDEIVLIPGRAALTAGAKIEHNDYSGFEVQPSVRGWWAPGERHTLWAAATRALRTPSRIEHDISLTSFAPMFGGLVRLLGDPDFEPEETRAYELGYRYAGGAAFSADVAAFYNDLRHILTLELDAPFLEATPAPAHVVVPATFGNDAKGSAHGIELALHWQARPWWRLDLAYAYTQLDLRTTSAAALRAGAIAIEEGTPHHAASLRSALDFGRVWQWDTTLRYVDSVAGLGVQAYTELDLRLAYRVSTPLRVELVGRNLLDAAHPERPQGMLEVERSALLRAVWDW
jgi:iron complex outermembrane recepter protein